MWGANYNNQRNSNNDCNFFKTTRPLKQIKFYVQIAFLLIAFYFVRKRSIKIKIVHEIFRSENDMRHILIWTDLPGAALEGQQEFIKNSCESQFCYLTRNRTLFNDTRFFDAIVFNLQELSNGSHDLPKFRGEYQKYVFVANDSADKYPVCESVYDGFFNWTWTYRSDSTVSYQFIVTQNKDGQNLKGQHILWQTPQKKQALQSLMKRTISTKRKAAAIFLDECTSRSKREDLIKNLQKELAKYNLTVDIYGQCGNMNCRRRSMGACNYRIRNDYFFYLALEETIAKDFVTDVVLHAYDNNAVPIVNGGADYLQFVPENSYLDVKEFNLTDLVKKMYQLMYHKHLYLEYFRWKNYYTISKEIPLDVCDLCAVLSIPRLLVHKVQWNDFRVWWHPDFKTRCAEEKRNRVTMPNIDRHYY